MIWKIIKLSRDDVPRSQIIHHCHIFWGSRYQDPQHILTRVNMIIHTSTDCLDFLHFLEQRYKLVDIVQKAEWHAHVFQAHVAPVTLSALSVDPRNSIKSFPHLVEYWDVYTDQLHTSIISGKYGTDQIWNWPFDRLIKSTICLQQVVCQCPRSWK